ILDPLQDTYTYGQIVNLTAIPSEGWSFLGWSGDINETANPTQIIIDGNKTVTATFFLANRPPQIDSYTPTTDPAILEGDAQEFTISPSDPDGDDLHIQWYVNDAPVGTNSTEYTFTSDYASAGTYNITVTVSDGLEQATRTWTLTVTDVGPVLDMPFDADANPTPDNSGYGNNGTVNGATWTTAGNGSYYFDGNDYILINDADSLDGNGTWDGMTAELWVYLTTNQQGTRILAKRVSTGTGTDKSYQIGFQSAAPANRIYAGVYLSTSATYYEAGYSTPLNLRTWYHVAMVYNSSTGLILYINGIAVAANTTATGLIKASTQPLCIGSMTSSTGNFTGILDNVRIFSKALPQEQIIRHYDEAVAVHVNTPPIITSHTPETLEPQVNEGEELPFTQTSIDPERDPTSYTWLLDGEAKSNLQNWTYLPDFDGAGYHNVTLIVSDGFLQATIQWNVTVINVNRPPAITGYYPEEDPIISESASQEFNITCSDPDDDPLLIQWYVNDEAAETNLTSYMFPPSPVGTYHVAVMVSDGQAEDWRNWTLTVIAGNVPPEIESVTISPKPAYNSDTLTATPNGWSDPNGDPEGYVWQWQKWDGAEWINITDATSNTLEPLNFANGDQIRVLCTPYDGQAYGETKYDTVTIENRAPTITSYTPTESYPCINQSQQQVFNASANDPDGDQISYTWYLDGASVSTTDSYTFDATLDTSGVHNITIVVEDGYGAQAKQVWFLTVDANLVMPFDTNAIPVVDYAGYDNNGTVTGATWTSNGKINGAYTFDGNDFIRVEDSPNLGGDGTWSQITIEFWVYVTENQRGTRIISKRGSTTGTYSYQIGFQTLTTKPYNTIYFDIWNASNSYREIEYQSLSLNTWYYIACTYDGTTMRMYINGNLINSTSCKGNIYSSIGIPLYVGSMNSTHYFCRAIIDEIRIYPKALTADQISRSYNQTMNLVVGYSPATTQTPSANLTY
ncbi:MAG: LamG-like jellyroll fold domain-containing protein, partial [Candidatus Bathyarchaeia archaeon]